jgi:tetratricopeptide (TPR) repeat protein
LLEDAHRKSRLESSNPNQSKHDGDSSLSQQIRERDDTIPVWAKSGKSGAGEKDIGAIAAEVGGNIFKSANNLWNTSMKKVEKAVSDLRVDLSADNISGPPQPKWMRERQIREELEKRGARGISRQDRPPRNTLDQELDSGKNNALITEEALMLETNCGPPKSRRKNKEDTPIAIPAFVRNSQPAGLSEHEQIIHRRQQRLESAIWDKERDVRERERVEMDPVIPDNSSRKAKMALSDEPVYVSRNRRRLPKSAPLATSPRRQTPEPDLLGVGGGYTNHSTTTTGSSLNPFDCNIERTKSPTSSVTPAAPPARCHRVPQRPHIPVSPSALSQSNAARQKGTEAFKRGDYTAAQAAYTSALIPLPDQHTLRIVILANRSLCTLKLGDPKSALADLDEILTHIGDSHGECETILLDNTEREMTEYWTKAITRKAEALEQLEKWTDAKAVWELALLSPGSSGSTSLAINGKRRCESALKPKPKAPHEKPRLL